MKMNILAATVATLLAPQAQSTIFLSEYIEGSSYNKAIEIANDSENAITLNGYSLKKATNGRDTWGQSMALDNVTIAPHSVFVLSHPSANSDIQLVTDQSDANVINFNGDDPIALFLNDTIVDIIGVMGDINFGKDQTLVRIDYTPSTAFNLAQWEVRRKNDSSDLGQLADGNSPAVEASEVTIMDIQGDSWFSPLIDSGYLSTENYQTEGVITAIQNKALGNDINQGFFIQDQQGDNNPLTSDGLFVDYADLAGLNVGDKVVVVGKVNENYGWTTLLGSQVERVSSGESIEATSLQTLSSDESFRETLERYEGMLVSLEKASDLRVTRTYGFDYSAYRNNMVVAHQRVNFHPNQLNTPVTYDDVIDSPAEQQLANNKDQRIVIESFEKASNGVVPWYPEFGITDIDQNGSTEDYIRIGDLVDGLHGVLGYSYAEYRLYVTNQAHTDSFIHEENDRTNTPELTKGDLQVATFNVLNYFNSPFGGAANPKGQNRGATTLVDFEMQANKIVAALKAMNADIVGLMEIENNGFGANSAIVDLVSQLNAELPLADQYQIAWDGELEQVGSDAITNQVIYKPAKVTLKQMRVLQMPEQHAPAVGDEDGNNYQRDAITPTFSINGSDQTLTVAVNHFKSKGSTCWEDVAIQQGQDPNRQGSCENLRVSAAYQLGESLMAVSGHKLIIGDLNSYAAEDPISVLTDMTHLPTDYEVKAARSTYVGETPLHGDEGAVITKSYGYTNVVKTFHPNAYGYSYNDEVGTLDYILASPSLISHLVDAAEWNINAVESSLFEYSSEYSGDLPKYADAYRASDHDPVIVALSFKPQQLLGDFDGDLDIDSLDVSSFYQAIRSASISDLAYDFNHDGQINRRDLRGLMDLCTRARCATH
ncbi:ExeM/NucH family extracellular endonuclease [Agarivorans sp. QJM3NY_33]|uniref:ExeM/NucH family extracellular endonuclease n=1 Tax=Agarivorans sp. QJM3NY_33 TaxID=3421432 RepID=UPI003D7D4CDE